VDILNKKKSIARTDTIELTDYTKTDSVSNKIYSANKNREQFYRRNKNQGKRTILYHRVQRYKLRSKKKFQLFQGLPVRKICPRMVSLESWVPVPPPDAAACYWYVQYCIHVLHTYTSTCARHHSLLSWLLIKERRSPVLFVPSRVSLARLRDTLQQPP